MYNITFLGLGAMGSRMAAQLINAGHKVTVWNRSEEATEPLVTMGAQSAASPALAAEGADYVISMVRDDEASKAVWLDKQNGALQAMSENAVAIESSTLTPEWIARLHSEFERSAIAFADAPVAGSIPQAQSAQLIYFAGCDAETFERIQPVLSVMGGAIHHCGVVGTGASIKLAFNALFGIQLAAVAELLGLLKNSGIELTRAMEIISSTPACSPAVKISAQAMVAGNFTPMFPIELVRKDLSYLESTAAKLNIDLPVSRTGRLVTDQAIEQGLGDLHITGLAKLYI